MGKLEALFSSLAINGLVLKNRLVMPPMHTDFGTEEGGVTPRLREYYARRARGGVALIIQEATSVLREGRASRQWLGIWDDSFVAGCRELVAAVHDAGAKIAVQLHHAGGVTSSKVTGAQPVAPWPWKYREAPHILTVDEIAGIEDAFSQGARRAVEAGYDAVEIHAAHGYLVSQFLSPLSNQREDEYGGAVDARALFARNIVAKVRRVVGPAFPISVRLSIEEFLPGGTTLEESKRVAALLVDSGADVIHASGGRMPALEDIIGPMEVPHGHLVNLAAGIRESVSVPVIAVGRITDVRMAEDILRAGKCDLVSMGRALVADPDLPMKAEAGNVDDIRPCIGCHQGCLTDPAMSCLSNPETGYEAEMSIVPARQPKKVVVIGGGPGGMEAARVAALRGNSVMLFERETELGGRLRAGTIPPHKQDIALLIAYLQGQLGKLGVEVRLGVPATKTVVSENHADQVIVATGGTAIVPNLPGVDRANVVLAEDVLLGRATVGRRVVVMGAGTTGCEVAEYLASQGRNVVIVTRIERDADIAADLPYHRKRLLMARLPKMGIEILKATKLAAIDDRGVVVQRADNSEAHLEADSVVLAQGYRPDSLLAQELSSLGLPIHVIGDAVECRTAKEAIREGALVGRLPGS